VGAFSYTNMCANLSYLLFGRLGAYVATQEIQSEMGVGKNVALE